MLTVFTVLQVNTQHHLPPKMSTTVINPKSPFSIIVTLISVFLYLTPIINSRTVRTIPSKSHLSDDSSVTYLWPLPSEFTSGNETLTVNPNLSLSVSGNGASSGIVRDAFDRYRNIIFKHASSSESRKLGYDVSKLTIIINSNNEEVSLYKYVEIYVCISI